MTESDPERTHRSRCVSVLNSSHPRADLGRDRAQKGQAWGLKTIESFHTHGTPPIHR
jgi:hypothetical protein